jgi:hypothetical protein
MLILNYREQPTQFYALAITMAVLGDQSVASRRLAWTYVGLRVAHSVAHAAVNYVPARGSTVSLSPCMEQDIIELIAVNQQYLLSSMVLLALGVRAATLVM